MYYKINQKKGKRKEERNTKSLSLFFFFFSFDFSLSLLFSHVCSSPIKKFPSTLHRFPPFWKRIQKTHTYGVYPPFWGENAWLFSIFFGVRHIAKVESFLWVCVQSDCKNDLLCFFFFKIKKRDRMDGHSETSFRVHTVRYINIYYTCTHRATVQSSHDVIFAQEKKNPLFLFPFVLCKKT